MLLQTNSYIVPKEKRAEHSRLIRRFRQTLLRLGCDHFEVYEQVGANWSNSESAGRYVQILRFLDRKHQLAVQAAERTDPTAQAVIADFCDLINFPYQQQQGLFAVGFYTSVLPVAPKRGARGELVSTVEHEVIDDPDAEMPYPGASDGPPMEPSSVEEAVGEETVIVEPIPDESLLMPEAMIEPVSEKTADIAEVFASEPIHSDVPGQREPLDVEVAETPLHHDPDPIEELIEEPVHANAEHSERSSAADDFLSLVSGDLHREGSLHEKAALEDPFAEDSDDDASHGFIEVNLDDSIDGEKHNGNPDVQPAHHDAKDHPPGW